MTNADYTHLTLVVDRSGSMSSVQEEAQGGTTLVAEQFALRGAHGDAEPVRRRFRHRGRG